MKRIILILAVLAVSCTSTKKEPESLASVFQRINTEVLANSKAYETLGESCSTIGHRLTGSENGHKAEEYVYNKLKEYGFQDVAYKEFEVDAWSRGEVAVTIKDNSEEKEIPSVSLGHSPVSADVTGDIVFMGNGLRSDYAENPGKAEGKIVLVYIGLLPGSPEGTRNIHRSNKTALAIENGAIGVIIFNQVDGGVLLTGTASVTGELLPVPAVCIGKEDGMALKDKLADGNISAHISMTNFSGPIKARDVVATLPGSELPDEKIIVGGHLDSWDLATGAIDNGIGSFAVLDIARSFMASNLKPKRTVKFVLFMGEEQGLLGSTYLVDQYVKSGEIDKVKYMMNLDMTGNPVGFSTGGRDEASDFFKELGEKIREVDTTFTNSMRNGVGLHSDHQPFLLQGIPTIGMISNLDRSIYRCYHSDCDDFSLVNKEHITNTVRFGTMALYGIAEADSIPAKRLSDSETREFLEKAGLKEELELQKNWRWNE